MKDKNIYLLLGPEEGEKSLFIKKLIKSKKDTLEDEPEIYRFYPFESSMLDIVTLLNSGSLFSSYKFVILYRVDEIKKVAEVKLLEEYCSSPSDCASLIMLSTQTRLSSKKVEKLVPPKNRVVYWELNENQKKGWIINYFRQRNIDIDQGGVNFFVEMVENNTKDIRLECNKLANFFPPGTAITSKDIETYVYHSKEENVFTLFEKIALRNLGASLEILEKIFLSGDSNGVGLLSGLLWQVRRILSLKSLREQNYSSDEIFRTLKIFGKKSQKIYIEAHKNYSKEEISAIIVLLHDYDIKLRSFRADSYNLLLQLLVYTVIVNGGIRRSPLLSKW